MGARRVSPVDGGEPDDAAWEDLIAAWPPACATPPEQRRRRAWRRGAVGLVVERHGIPAHLRKRVWSLVLGAAAASEPLNSEDEVHLVQAATDAGTPRDGTPCGTPRGDATPLGDATPRDEASSPYDVVHVSPRGRASSPAAAASPPAAATPKMSTPSDHDRWAIPRSSDRRGSRGSSQTSHLSNEKEVPRQIALDVPRTFGAVEPHGLDEETRLQSLLNEFARTASPALRYCQGMNFLAVTILRVFKGDGAAVVDEHAVTVFRGLMVLVKPLYVPDFRGLREMVGVAGALLPKFAPILASILEEEGLDLMPITSSWCLTLFASTSMDDSVILTCWDFLLLGTPGANELEAPPKPVAAALTPRGRETQPRGRDAPPRHAGALANHADAVLRPASHRRAPGSPKPKPPHKSMSMRGALRGALGAASRARKRAALDDEAGAGHSHGGGGHLARWRGAGRRTDSMRGIFNAADQFNAMSVSRRSHGDGVDDDDDDNDRMSASLPNTPSPDIVMPQTPQVHKAKTYYGSFRRALSRLPGSHAPPPHVATTERHVMLLRLCLVFLRNGEQLMAARQECDLETVALLLGTGQNRNRLGDQGPAPPSGASCFPATAAALCNVLKQTKVDSKFVAGYVRKHPARSSAETTAAAKAAAAGEPKNLKKSLRGFFKKPQTDPSAQTL
ncbi:rab-GTPase-TBC domain-containing protein [Pelagophyceae sp. CCMP2097]|nr:rab-GTPase-TBC domain-containing protein [Pelagophyceae sp. CCMP2097]